MVQVRDYERVAGSGWPAAGVERVEALVAGTAADGSVEGADLRGRWVFDTRPTPPARPGRVALLQHFRGWRVRTAQDRFDPSVAGLMDFRPPQPRGGVAFGYVLPTSRREALVEYTSSPARC
jgi:lycopene beta-cyclase